MALKVEFQGDAKNEGIEYEDDCEKALLRYGFAIVTTKYRDEDSGVEIDIVARNKRGIDLYFECKGGKEKGQKLGGFKSSDNVRKAIGSATSWYYGGGSYGDHPFIVLTTYIMPIVSANFKQLAVLPSKIMADVINDRDASRLKWWANIDDYGIQAHYADYPLLEFVLKANSYWRMR